MAEEDDRGPLTVGALGRIADHLAEVLDEFRAWKIPVSKAGRLSKILNLITDTASAGQYPNGDEDLLRVGTALQTAQEFIEIGNSLPTARIEVVAQDIEIALGGTLDWRPGNKAPLQRQTQLWTGAMMVQAGAPTGVLEHPVGKNPDYELQNGTMRYAVEVKRPESNNGAAGLVRTASRQIRSGRYHGGSIVMDLTDCIDESIECVIASGIPGPEALHEELVSRVQSLHHRIFDDSDSVLRSGREHVFGLVAFARHQFWNRDDLSVPYLGKAVVTVEYQRGGPRTLKAHRAKWLGRLVHDGIVKSGHEQVGQVDVSSLLESD